ncbi:MAG: glycosyltransferase family 9 protein [Phycisphaerales bacterium]|nr:glycosyltransferase family 9 protein [Phycisphaerales bacterium]
MSHDWVILHGGALGDLCLCIQLALRLPGVRERGVLRVVSRTCLGDLSACSPRVERYSSDALGLHALFDRGGGVALPPRLREIIAGRWVLSTIGGPDHAVCHRLVAGGAAAVWELDPAPRPGSARHAIDQWAAQLTAAGLVLPPCARGRELRCALHVPDALRAAGRALALAAAGGGLATRGARPVIALHPGSGGRRKCWPVDRFAAVASLLRARLGAVVAWLIGPVELEQWPADTIGALDREGGVIASSEADELAALLAGVDVLVCNDSGPGHLAALLGTPTVSIFGPSDARVWRPRGARSVVVAGAELERPDWGIAAEQVADCVAAVLSQAAPPFSHSVVEASAGRGGATSTVPSQEQPACLSAPPES